jgi:hypothetical protein
LRVDTVDIGSTEISPDYGGVLPSALVNQGYNHILSPAVGSFTYTQTTGTLPPGINVTTGSVVALANGTPTQTGTYFFGVTVSNGSNSTVVNYQMSVLSDLSVVPLTGRVINAFGSGIRGIVVLTDQGGNTRFVPTNGFGYFYFPEVAAGATYTIELASKQYPVAPLVMTVSDATSNLTLVAN